MRDFSISNVYKSTFFELYSEKRNRSFRFVRYTGNNYIELCKYIHEISPNTEIWNEDKLTEQCFYSYSGRTYQFHEIPFWEVRCCIASNPFRIIDDRKISLTLSKYEAECYLRLSDYHSVFCFEELTVDYMYNSKDGNFVLVDRNHPKGISCTGLSNHTEWYIGSSDNIHKIPNVCNPVYQHDIHVVHFEYGLREKADKIVDLIYEINSLSHITNNGSVIFKPSWEDTRRYRGLYCKCYNESRLKEFIQVLYNYIYEETKGYGKGETKYKKTRMTLPQEYRNSPFVIMVGEYRNYFDHGISEYETHQESISQIFLKYLNINTPPKQASDFEKIQLGLLNDFVSFLIDLLDFVGRNRKIIGYISTDDQYNVYCQNALLPKEMIKYKGCKCQISKFTKNNLKGLNSVYEYFCQFPDFVFIKRNGLISYDGNGALVVDKILLSDDSLKKYIGMSVSISRIFIANKDYRDKGYDSIACELEIILSSPVTDKINIVNGLPQVSSYTLSQEWVASKDSKVMIKGIRATMKYIGSPYTITPLCEVLEGVISIDDEGTPYCCNTILAQYAKDYRGKRIKMGRKTINLNTKYPRFSFYCNDFSIIESV